ncbi:hypothetical protein FAI40_08510 [Acetobacteraceae bacterium]|nr:hypothetical protein FAI40_08510 [Acetobacteraceae bacterium]
MAENQNNTISEKDKSACKMLWLHSASGASKSFLSRTNALLTILVEWAEIQAEKRDSLELSMLAEALSLHQDQLEDVLQSVSNDIAEYEKLDGKVNA